MQREFVDVDGLVVGGGPAGVWGGGRLAQLGRGGGGRGGVAGLA
jgi:hypothetical protein